MSIIIGSRQQLKKVSVAELSVGDTSVAPASAARNLGVLFHPHLKFDAQITKTCCTGYYYRHNIRKIRKNHSEPTKSVCVADCYFIVNVLDLPFASPIAIYR